MTQTVLDQIGGEEAAQMLVTRFYDLMETRPEAQEIHRLHFRGHGIAHTRIEQLNFMIGFMGGRQHYRELHGHMDLREIHAHVPIREDDAEVWLETFDMALADCAMNGTHIDRLRATLRRAALMLVNDLPDWRKGETA